MEKEINKQRILVVDDIEHNRELIKSYFTEEGFIVDSAESGKIAIEMISKTDFDIVLLDIMMPEMSGLEVLEIIRKDWKKTELPVVMVTANNESEDVVEALESDANDYILKPIDFAIAHARINIQVELKRVHHSLSLATKAALQASVAKSEFLSTMSHEIRTPLNAILGMADVLRETELSSEQIQYVDVLRRAGDALLEPVSYTHLTLPTKRIV